MYFLSNVSGCPRVAAFPTTLIAKNYDLDIPTIAVIYSYN